MPNILFTGTNPNHFTRLGSIIHLPMIELSANPLDEVFTRPLIEHLNDYDMIVLTSRFSVKYFFDLLTKNDYYISQLSTQDFIVIGTHTQSALKDKGLDAALTASIETSEGLFKAMTQKYDLKGKKILFPRSSLPNPSLQNRLTEAGAKVDAFAVYQNTKPAVRPLPMEPVDRIIFTSPSTVRNFLADYETIPQEWTILSKGSVTANYLKQRGYDSVLVHC